MLFHSLTFAIFFIIVFILYIKLSHQLQYSSDLILENFQNKESINKTL